MPWGWSIHNEPLKTGGALGTPAEARQTNAWPDYESEYLKRRLQPESAKGRFDPTYYDREGTRQVLKDEAKYVYLDKVSANYKDEAEACLKQEFADWLQGKHQANDEQAYYMNGDNKPRRRNVYTGDVSKDLDEWKHTPWGKEQLTHLPGVRDYLREAAKHKDFAELQMNLLAEHGPQNLEEAWMYFKHWVKGRPVDVDQCISRSKEMGLRSDFGYQPPGRDPYYNGSKTANGSEDADMPDLGFGRAGDGDDDNDDVPISTEDAKKLATEAAREAEQAMNAARNDQGNREKARAAAARRDEAQETANFAKIQAEQQEAERRFVEAKEQAKRAEAQLAAEEAVRTQQAEARRENLESVEAALNERQKELQAQYENLQRHTNDIENERDRRIAAATTAEDRLAAQEAFLKQRKDMMQFWQQQQVELEKTRQQEEERLEGLRQQRALDEQAELELISRKRQELDQVKASMELEYQQTVLAGQKLDAIQDELRFRSQIPRRPTTTSRRPPVGAKPRRLAGAHGAILASRDRTRERDRRADRPRERDRELPSNIFSTGVPPPDTVPPSGVPPPDTVPSSGVPPPAEPDVKSDPDVVYLGGVSGPPNRMIFQPDTNYGMIQLSRAAQEREARARAAAVDLT